MRTIYRALIATSLLLASVHASADITLVKADSADSADSESLNQHRYENAIKKMDSDSDQITKEGFEETCGGDQH